MIWGQGLTPVRCSYCSTAGAIMVRCEMYEIEQDGRLKRKGETRDEEEVAESNGIA